MIQATTDEELVPSLSRGASYKYRKRTKISHDFRYYEKSVTIVTQLSYIPVAASMLCTTFFEPSGRFCDNNTLDYQDKDEFKSLLFEWEIICSKTSVVTYLSVALMTGALIGAFIAGWLADLYGRIPVLKGCLLLIAIGNILVALFSTSSIPLTIVLFAILGVACGGYMVVNLVMFVECLEVPQARLLAVTLNGWSIAMIFVAILAWLTLHWQYYHIITAILSFIAFIAFNLFLVESCRWLDSIRRTSEAYETAVKIAKKNNYNYNENNLWWEILRFSSAAAHSDNNDSSSIKAYNYIDLFRTSRVFIPLIALAYCFIATSIVSFGFYFILDVLPGNRYINMSIMGFTKFLMGWIPFFASQWIGRRPVVLASVGVASIASWLACTTYFVGLPNNHWCHAVLSLIISASLDPTWKILHLYSTELFPTAIRNMARAVCNVGARLGSVLAPTVVHLRSVNPVIPLSIFTILLTLQLVVTIAFLPETKDKPLPSNFPVKQKNIEVNVS